jgi:rSAM/selenodomain-associated transferase 1
MLERQAARPILIIFARNPVPGLVKTRLIPSLGEEGACALYLKLLQCTLDTAMQCSDVTIELWTDTATLAGELHRMIADRSLRLRRQRGSDLGLRMHHAISDALNRSSRVVLIGSDCPDWRAEDLMQAFNQLQGHDAVLAPAMDGGYVLIGCRRHAVELFSDIPWGSDQVYAITKNRLRSLGWRWHELPAHPDIDCEPDLKLVPELLD